MLVAAVLTPPARVEPAARDELGSAADPEPPATVAAGGPEQDHEPDLDESMRRVLTFFDVGGEYEQLKLKIVAAESKRLVDPADAGATLRLAGYDVMLNALALDLVEWHAAGAVGMPPMAFRDHAALPLPALWKPPDSGTTGTDARDASPPHRPPSPSPPPPPAPLLRTATKPPQPRLPGAMLPLFASPIYVINLVAEGAVTAAFNARLAAHAIDGA